MLKRFSRRAMRSFAVACLTLAVGLSVGAEFANSAVFSGTQTFTINGSSASNLSQVCVYNYNTGAFPCYPAFFGSYTLSYQLPFNVFLGFILYDYNQARFVEQVFVRDEAL
jgi:hypothetical protein